MLKHDGKIQTAGHAGGRGSGRHDGRHASGHQAGDLICGIEAIIKVVEGFDSPRPPLPGHDAYEGVMAALSGPRVPTAPAGRAARGEEHPDVGT